MNLTIATSYFYQIRNFKKNIIPVSTCLSDPRWYRPPQGQEYYFDKRGIINGLRYEPLVVQPRCGCPCPMQHKRKEFCDFLYEYKRNLYLDVDFDKMINSFKYCANKFKYLSNEEPIIALMVYEAPTECCSERQVLQEYFSTKGYECKELNYPIL